MKKKWLGKRHLFIAVFILLVILEATHTTHFSSKVINLYLEKYTQLNHKNLIDNIKQNILPLLSEKAKDFLSFSNNSEGNNSVNSQQLEKLRKKNKALEEALVIQKTLAQERFFLQKENDNLKKQLNYIKSSSYKIITAEITLIDPQNHFISLWVNKGSKQKIKTGQAVVAYQNSSVGLVGFVLKVYKNTSLIQTIVDRQSHISVTVSDTQSKAIVKGQSKLKPYLKVEYIDIALTNLINKTVFTTGLGDKYPAGLEVGQIKMIEEEGYGLFKEAKLIPLINFFTLTDVLIILKNN